MASEDDDGGASKPRGVPLLVRAHNFESGRTASAEMSAFDGLKASDVRKTLLEARLNADADQQRLAAVRGLEALVERACLGVRMRVAQALPPAEIVLELERELNEVRGVFGDGDFDAVPERIAQLIALANRLLGSGSADA